MESFRSYPGIRMSEAGGIYSSTLLTGFLGSFSYVLAPSIAIAPPLLLLKQYQKAGYIGFTTAPRLAYGTACVYGWLAVSAFRVGGRVPGYAYAAAAVLAPMIVPYTILFLAPINAKLNGVASVGAHDDGKVDESEVQALWQTWKKYNYGRAAVAMIASGFGIFGTLAWKL